MPWCLLRPSDLSPNYGTGSCRSDWQTLDHVAGPVPDYVLLYITVGTPTVLKVATMSGPDHDDSQSSSDELDEDYHYAQMATPPRSSRPILYVTPRHRADRTSSLSTAAKHSVVSKSRTPEQCFMTLENSLQSAIDVCHFISKTAKASEVRSKTLANCMFLNPFPGAAFGTGV